MQRADRRAVEPNESSALEHAVNDNWGQVVVMQNATPSLQGLG